MKDKKKLLRMAVFICVGAFVGYLYNVLIGCSGSCTLGGSPPSVMLQTGFAGFILAKLFEK